MKPTAALSTGDYRRISRAIAFIAGNLERQPDLHTIAAHVHLSPFHFQRLFSRWTGTSPKRLMQLLTLERCKQRLSMSASMLDLSYSVGLSSNSRLHEHFVQIEAVTPGEYKNLGKGLVIHYGVAATPCGWMFVAQTPRGICLAEFVEDREGDTAMARLKKNYPLAQTRRNDAVAARVVVAMQAEPEQKLRLHLSGTNFQLALWRALLRIPRGSKISYSALANLLGRPGAIRAAGNAVAANPVAFFIPCHRVIRQSGALGNYRWGVERKQMLQWWESMHASHRGFPESRDAPALRCD